MCRCLLALIVLLVFLCGCTGTQGSRAGTPQNSKAIGVWEATPTTMLNVKRVRITFKATGKGTFSTLRQNDDSEEKPFDWKEAAGVVTMYPSNEFMVSSVQTVKLSPDASTLVWNGITLKRKEVKP